MKRIIAIVLAVFLAAGFSFTFSFADESEYTNYLTHKWEATFFPGKLTEKEEDGDIVTKYIPNYDATWFSPQLSVLDDLKTIAEGNEYVSVSFYVELRGVFQNPSATTSFKFLFRAIDSHSNSYSYKAEEMDDWYGSGSTWNDLYYELLEDGDLYFTSDSGVNVMADLYPASVEVSGDDWTVFESDPILIPSALLNSNLFSDLILCMDFAPGGFTGGFKGIEMKNTAIYNVDEHAGSAEPTAEPEEPTAEPADPTDAGVTEKPAETAKPADPTIEPTDAPAKKKGCGGTVIGLAAPVLLAAAAFVFRKKKG